MNLLKEEKIALVIWCNLMFLLVVGYIEYRIVYDVAYRSAVEQVKKEVKNAIRVDFGFQN